MRAAILTGAGKAFVAGADIGAMANMTTTEAKRFADAGHAFGALLETAPFPVIAAVNGFALGGGCELALACDFILAADNAKLGQPEVNLGIIPGFGGTQRLVRRVGAARARELIFTGDMINAEQALAIGLVNSVVPAADLLARAREVALKIASRGPWPSPPPSASSSAASPWTSPPPASSKCRPSPRSSAARIRRPA